MGDVSNNPVLVYVAVGVGALIILAGAVPRILGPLGTALSDWTQTKRRVATESDDARVADLRKDVDYLKTELLSLRTEMRTRNEYIRVHEEWDRKLIRSYLIDVPSADISSPPKLDYP